MQVRKSLFLCFMFHFFTLSNLFGLIILKLDRLIVCPIVCQYTFLACNTLTLSFNIYTLYFCVSNHKPTRRVFWTHLKPSKLLWFEHQYQPSDGNIFRILNFMPRVRWAPKWTQYYRRWYVSKSEYTCLS